MKSHPLSRVAPSGVSETFTHRRETYTFHRPTAAGDVAFRVLYPDPYEAKQVCRHAARVNGRGTSYPLDSYDYAQAILACLETPAGYEEPDITTVLAVYDLDPALWQKLSSAALRVLGLADSDSEVNGESCWSRVHWLIGEAFREAPCGELVEALRVSLAAVDSYRQSTETEPRVELDQVMESHLGNSSEAAPSPGHGSASSSGR